MQEKLEQIMRQIYLMLSNCEESAYSKEDIIVPKNRLFPLLEELNYAVYDLMEQYEGTVASRERGIAEQERKMKQIKEEAKGKAEDIYSASLLSARETFLDIKSITEALYKNLRQEYDDALKLLEEKVNFIKENETGTADQILLMSEQKKYLRIIEQQNKEQEQKKNLSEDEKKKLMEIQKEQEELAAAEASSELSQKIAAPIVVQVSEQPRIPEGFSKKQNKKKKAAPSTALEETSVEGEGVVSAPNLPAPEELDKEYFDFKSETESGEEGKGKEKKDPKWAFWRK